MGTTSKRNVGHARRLRIPAPPEAKQKVLEVYPDAFVCHHKVIVGKKKPKVTLYHIIVAKTEDGIYLTGRWSYESESDAWKNAWQNIQKRMLEKLESGTINVL